MQVVFERLSRRTFYQEKGDLREWRFFFCLFFSNKTRRKAFTILNEVLSDILRRKYPRSHMCEISFSVLLMAIREARLPRERPCWQLRNNTVTSANVTKPSLSLSSQHAHSSQLYPNWNIRPSFLPCSRLPFAILLQICLPYLKSKEWIKEEITGSKHCRVSLCHDEERALYSFPQLGG